MSHHQRTLPHLYPPEATLFLTWRLFGSLPRCVRPEPEAKNQSAGQMFVSRDRELDRAAVGPLWLKNPRIAQVVTEALHKGGAEFGLYQLFAWVVMPNHVHIVFRPLRPLSEVTRWIKGSTARSANLLLNRTGKPFWQYESYDHYVRDDAELSRIIRYIERNPVAAGLVEAIEDWPWSSAAAEKHRPKAYSTSVFDEQIN